MIPTLIYVIGRIRRALRKLGRGLLLVGEIFSEVQDARRAARRLYTEE
jgi:hypothetical protein